MGSALGLALLLQESLVLHCASLAIGGNATLLLGESGAGKSTLAQQMSMNGYGALGDDTCALWNAVDGSDACGLSVRDRVQAVAQCAGCSRHRSVRPAIGR